MNTISTVIIPIAGKGTRFLPITKTVTKTMFPIINKPVIQYLIEEAIKAGINTIIFVIGKEQEMIKDYFNLNSIYYNTLNKDFIELESLSKVVNQVEVKYVIQENPRGLGDAIRCCEDYIEEDAFSVILGDDLIISNEEKYGIFDLIEEYNNNPAHYIGIKEVRLEDINKYGIVKLEGMRVVDMVEKPESNAPSRYAAVGRYVLKKSIFQYLKDIHYDGVSEIQLTDAIKGIVNKENVYGVDFTGARFDIGDHAGYVMANVYASLQNKETKNKVLSFIKAV